MSVVNQMLRDLDARRAGATRPVLEAGVAAVASPRRPLGKPVRGVVAVVAVAALGAGVLMTGGWASAEAPLMAAAPKPVAPKPVAAPIAQPVVVAKAAAVEAPQPVTAPAVAAPVAAQATEPSIAPAVMLPPRPIAKPIQVAIAAPTARSLPRPTLPAASATSSAPATPASSAPALPGSALPQKQFALVDRVQAARELWSAGNGEAATALLREAIAVPGTDASGRAMAARELARLELMARDPAGALQTLDRHATDLRGDAQAWALRGNAAQRLGRHDDAVLAFEAAVRLQGDDVRSMLGAAVSLAATGDLAQSRVWADRARRSGPLPAEVLAYLTRAGVSADK